MENQKMENISESSFFVKKNLFYFNKNDKMVLWREKNDRAQKYRRMRTMSCTLIDSGRAGGEWGDKETLAKLIFLVSFGGNRQDASPTTVFFLQ